MNKFKVFNYGNYIFELKDNYLFVIDNPVTDLSSIDFFEINKIDGIYNLKSKSNENDFAIALIINGNFYYRTIKRTIENIKLYLEMIKSIQKFKEDV